MKARWMACLAVAMIGCGAAEGSGPVGPDDAGSPARDSATPTTYGYDAIAPAPEPDAAPVACVKPPAEDAGASGNDCLPIGENTWCDTFCGRPSNFYCHGGPPVGDCVRGPDQGIRTGWCCAPSTVTCTRASEFDSNCNGQTARACPSNPDGSPAATPSDGGNCSALTGAISASVGTSLFCCQH